MCECVCDESTHMNLCGVGLQCFADESDFVGSCFFTS